MRAAPRSCVMCVWGAMSGGVRWVVGDWKEGVEFLCVCHVQYVYCMHVSGKAEWAQGEYRGAWFDIGSVLGRGGGAMR